MDDMHSVNCATVQSGAGQAGLAIGRALAGHAVRDPRSRRLRPRPRGGGRSDLRFNCPLPGEATAPGRYPD